MRPLGIVMVVAGGILWMFAAVLFSMKRQSKFEDWLEERHGPEIGRYKLASRIYGRWGHLKFRLLLVGFPLVVVGRILAYGS